MLTDKQISELWSWSMTHEAEQTATTQQHAFARAIEQAVLSKQNPVAWMWQHPETGNIGFIEHAPPDEISHWERMNRPRVIVCPLYTAPINAAAQEKRNEV